MTSALQSKIIFFALLSFGITYRVLSRHNAESNPETTDRTSQRYSPYIPCFLLPLSIFTKIILEFLFHGLQSTAKTALFMCFGIFIHISLYYMLLTILLSLLRKWINARACSMLWMLPNYLYLAQQRNMEVNNPLLVICISEHLMWVLFCIWLTGFFIVLGYAMISHLLFRSQIVKNAVAVTDTAILTLWEHELEQAQIKDAHFELVTGANITTPLSIGLFRSTTLVVLPDQTYTPEELSLIFRHEIIHIGREDSWAKFFFVFCTAMNWFNPLMWTAMRKSAHDLELSCDETVLLNSDEDTRRQYATLILNTSHNNRGFTTCLSASASAMRYRLKNIMNPRKRYSGALTVGLVFFLLYMSYGYVSLAYDVGSGAEVIYHSEASELYTPRRISIMENSHLTTLECKDPEALHDYISNISLYSFQPNFLFTGKEKQLTISYNAPEGILSVTISNHLIKLVSPYVYSKGRTISYYYLPQDIDWDYLDTLLSKVS